MANIDNDLRAAILAEVSEYMDINPDLAQSVLEPNHGFYG